MIPPSPRAAGASPDASRSTITPQGVSRMGENPRKSSQLSDSCPAYGVRMAVKWLDDPEDHDYGAAADYLSLISEADAITATIDAPKAARPTPGPPARHQPPREGRCDQNRCGKEAFTGPAGPR